MIKPLHHWAIFQLPALGQPKHCGITLMEIIVAISVVGILSVLLIPKMLSTDDDLKVLTVKRTEDVIANVQNALTVYQDTTGNPLNFGTVPMLTIFRDYGHYFSSKVGTLPNQYYYYLSSGSRVTFHNVLFFSTPTAAEYTPPPIGPLDINNPWRDPDTDTGTCGDYPDNQCFFIDVNGAKTPNATGTEGDLVPVRVDPTTGSARTLYEWERDDIGLTPPVLCRFVSQYNMKKAPAPAC